MRFVGIALLVSCGSSTPTPIRPEDPNLIDRQASLSIETRYFDQEVTYYVSGPGVELAKLPMVEWLGLPWSGRGYVGVQVKVPLVNGAEDWSLADGTIKVGCEVCQMGDDQAKLFVGSTGTAAGTFAGDGIPFSHVAFSSIAAELKLTGGGAEITTWKLESKDVKVEVTGRMSLMPKLADSHVEACVRFAVTPELENRDPRLSTLLTVTGAARADDGMYNIRISGPLGSPRRLGQICDGSQPLAEIHDPLPADASPEPNVSDDDLSIAMDQGITKVNETTYDISLALLAKLLENPMNVAKGARVVPAMKDGKALGFKLYAIRPSSLFAKLGFSNGDTITAVGGQSTATADEALEVYGKLRDLKAGDMIYVDITRRAKPVTLTYTVSR